jgi:hypothetical protein
MKKTGWGLLTAFFWLCLFVVEPAFPTPITTSWDAALNAPSQVTSDYHSPGQSTALAVENHSLPILPGHFPSDYRYFGSYDPGGRAVFSDTCEVNAFPALNVSFLKGNIVCAYMIEASDNFNWIFTVWTLHACDFVAPAFQKPC